MESAVIFRSFNGALQSVSSVQSFPDKLASFRNYRDGPRRCLPFKVPMESQSLFISKSFKRTSILSSAKATKTSDAVPSGSAPQGLSPVKNIQKSTFPNGFQALVLEVCDESDVAEVKLKVGEFEMHLKRDTGSPAALSSIVPSIAPPATPPPVPSKPKVESGPVAPHATPKSIPASTSPFSNVSSVKASKLAALESSGSNTYVLVSSPTVGLFRRGRTLKGKKQPPSCKEGDMIKEGQIIGFLDQFGSELPVKSGVAGEVLKVLYKDGEPVGYGDPLVAVLPSFHGIK